MTTINNHDEITRINIARNMIKLDSESGINCKLNLMSIKDLLKFSDDLLRFTCIIVN